MPPKRLVIFKDFHGPRPDDTVISLIWLESAVTAALAK